MTGAGLKDEFLVKFHLLLSQDLIEAPRKEYKVGTAEADVWFEPKYVWEIKTADLSLSPIYTAGSSYTENNKGISLRFPRFIRERSDKKPTDATSSEEIFKLYKNQSTLNIGQYDKDDEGDASE